MRLPSWLAQHLAALRLLLVLTVVLGLVYPLALTAVAAVPGLQGKADGSLVSLDGRTVGSSLIGQSFTDADGHPLVQYFQSRPSAAGAGYDPTSTSASNLGPESVVDTLGDPALADSPDGDGSSASLLSQVCARSVAVGALEGVSGARPYCTPGGVGAVLAVFRSGGVSGPITRVVSLNEPAPATPFIATYQGVKVEPSRFGEDYRRGIVTPIRNPTAEPPPASAPQAAPAAPATSVVPATSVLQAAPVVPADAVTASASGLDPQINPAYARLQLARVAKARGITPPQVEALIKAATTGRTLGFMGEPAVNVLQLNLSLDRRYPFRPGPL